GVAGATSGSAAVAAGFSLRAKGLRGGPNAVMCGEPLVGWPEAGPARTATATPRSEAGPEGTNRRPDRVTVASQSSPETGNGRSNCCEDTRGPACASVDGAPEREGSSPDDEHADRVTVAVAMTAATTTRRMVELLGLWITGPVPAPTDTTAHRAAGPACAACRAISSRRPC